MHDLSPTKIALSKEQKHILSRLNSMLMYNYFPIVEHGMEESVNKPIDESNEQYKLGYLMGYGKAVWDITIDTSAACDGYLPDDDTIEKWVAESEAKFKELVEDIQEHEINGQKFTSFKFKDINKSKNV